MPVNYQIATIIIFSTMELFYIASPKPLPITTILDGDPITNTLDYAQHPNEILTIQPVQIYPLETPNSYELQGRELDDADNYDVANANNENNVGGVDSEIIYVQLLSRKAYRPTSRQNSNQLNDAAEDDDVNAAAAVRELTMDDIFYVKALANGQFSDERIKLYRIPEFYAVSVYRKGAAAAAARY